jgi:hypothetical protein
MLGLRVDSGPFPAPEGWNCRYCSGFEVFDERVCRRLDELVVPARKKASDERCVLNTEAMTFFQMMFCSE